MSPQVVLVGLLSIPLSTVYHESQILEFFELANLAIPKCGIDPLSSETSELGNQLITNGHEINYIKIRRNPLGSIETPI